MNKGYEVQMDRSMARSNVYKMLSSLFRYPEESNRSLMMMYGQRKKTLEESLNMLDEKYFTSCLEEFMNVCSPDNMASQEEMKDNSSFIGNLGRVLSDKEPISLRFYRGYGSSFKGSDREASVVIYKKAELNIQQLELMAILAEMESKAVCGEKIGLEELQLVFLSRFIAPSAPFFCEAIIKNSLLGFYRSLALLTREFIKFEGNYLGCVLNQVFSFNVR